MVDWSINGAEQGFQNALALGANIGGALKQRREDSALAAFMETNDPRQQGTLVATPEQKAASDEAYSRLLKVNPRLAYQVQGQMAERQAAQAKLLKEQRAADLRQKAAQGDPAALQELAGIDFDSWAKLDEGKRKMVKEQSDYTGQAALRISQIQDPAQQALAWDQAIDQGVQMGFTGLADHKGKFSPQALNAAIDNAGLVDKFISLAEPKYMAIPDEVGLVNVRDPNAVRQFQDGRKKSQTQPKQISSKAEYDALAPGSSYIAPDGSVKRKGGGSGNATGGFQ